MTRTDELTTSLLDGTFTETDWAELESLLASDSSAEEAHLALLELEAVLRGLRTDFDLAEQTLSKVKAAQTEKTARAVMAEIATHPMPAWAEPAEPVASGSRLSLRRAWFAAAGLLAVAVGLALGLWLGGREGEPKAEENVPAPLFAKLTRTTGSVELLSPLGDVQPGVEGGELPPGHTLRTIGEDSLARVELPDRTTVDIESDSVVRFIGANGGERKPHLFLASGQLTAALPDHLLERQLVIATGVAEVFSRNGTFVVSSAGPESVRVDIKRGKVDVIGTRVPRPVSVAKGAAVVRAGFENVLLEPAVRVDRTAARTLAFPNPRDATFSPDGNDVWVASPRQFTRWTRDGGTADTVFAARKGGYGPVAIFTRDKSTLIATSMGNKEEKTVREEKIVLRQLPRGEIWKELEVKLPEPRFWTAGPAAAWFALVDPRPNNKHMRVLEVDTGTQRFARDFEANVACLTASRDGRILAVGLTDVGRGGNNKVVLLDPGTGERLSALPTQKKGPAALAFSEDGRYLAVAFHGLVQIWDVRARELVKSITGFERVVTCLTFNAAGSALAAGTQDGQVWLWAAATGRPMQLIEVGSRGVRAVAFSPDGRRLVAVANNAPVGVWEVAEIATAATPD